MPVRVEEHCLKPLYISERQHTPSILLNRMYEMLGCPAVDLYGASIPGQEGKVKEQSYHKLMSIAPGKQVRLQELENSSQQIYSTISSDIIKLGSIITVSNIEDYATKALLSVTITRSLLPSAER